MGLFRNSRRAPAASWQPQTPEPGSCPGDLMEDPGCVSAEAYGAQFRHDAVPGIALTIWCYVSYGGSAEGYYVSYRIDHELDGHGDALLLSTDYYCDVTWAEWYEGLPDAEQAAHQAAADLIRDGAAAMPLHADQTVIQAWFDWAGETDWSNHS